MPLLPDNFKAFGFKEATSDFFTPSNKVDELQRRRDEKLEGLASKATNSYTSHQLQQALSNAIDQQVYTDKLTGKKYQEKYTHDALDNTVITKVPYTQKNIYGQEDLENLYIDTTKEGNYKLGLARPDKGFVGRYTEGTDGYGWAPGPKGVTPEDGALLDVTLPKSIAEELEYTIHSNKEQIRNRPYGTGAITPDIEKAYGSGKTEYTTPNAPLWNQDYNPMSVQGQITSNTKIPASPAEKAESKRRTAPGVESSFGESLLRAPQAAAAALTKSVYDMGDMAVELGSNLVARGAKALGASDDTVKYIDSIGLGTEKDKREVINDIFGYNDYYNQAAMKSTEEHYKKAVKDVDLFKPSTYKNIDMGEVAKSFSAAFSSPEAAAASIGYLVPYLVGAPEKVAVKALSSEGKVAFKALKDTAQSTTISAADKANKMADIRNMMSIADKAKMVLINNANALSLGSTMTNEQLEEVIAKNGGEMPTLWKVGTMVALNSVGAKLDMKAATDIISGKPLTEGWATAIGELGEQGARKAAAKVAEYGTKLIGAGFEELGQEFVQSYFEAFNKTYGTDTTNIVEGTRRIGALEAALSPEVRTEAAVGAIAGAAGGMHMAMPRELYSAGKEALAAPVEEFFKRDELEINPVEFATWDAKEKKDHYNKVTQKMALNLSKLDAVTAYNESEDKTIPDLQKAFEQTRALYDVGPDASEDLVTSAYTLMAGKIMDTLGSKLKGTPIQFINMGRMLRDNAPTEGAKQQIWDLVVEASEFEIQDKAPDFFKELRERMEGALPLDGLQLKEGERKKLEELKTQLGSEDLGGGENVPTDLIDMVLQFGTPNAPTFADVSKQIEETGTTLFGRYKKSLKQHERDITSEMLETKANDDGKVLTSNLDALGKFVSSRTLGKLHPVYKMWDEATRVYNPKVRSIASIHKLADTIMKDNIAIERTVDKLIEQARLNGNSVAEQELLGMKEKLAANNAEMLEVLQIDNAEDMMAMLEHVESRDGRDTISINEIVKELGGTERVVAKMSTMPGRSKTKATVNTKPAEEKPTEPVSTITEEKPKGVTAEEWEATLGKRGPNVKQEKTKTTNALSHAEKVAKNVENVVDGLKEIGKERKGPENTRYQKQVKLLKEAAKRGAGVMDDNVVQTLIEVLEKDSLKAATVERIKKVMSRRVAGTPLTSTQIRFMQDEISKIKEEQKAGPKSTNKYTHTLAPGELNKQAELVKAKSEIPVAGSEDDTKADTASTFVSVDPDKNLKGLSNKQREELEKQQEDGSIVHTEVVSEVQETKEADVEEIDTDNWTDEERVAFFENALVEVEELSVNIRSGESDYRLLAKEKEAKEAELKDKQKEADEWKQANPDKKGTSLAAAEALNIQREIKDIEKRLRELDKTLNEIGQERKRALNNAGTTSIEELKDKLKDAKNQEVYDTKTTEAIANLGGPLGLVAGKKSKKLTRLLAKVLATKDGKTVKDGKPRVLTASAMSLGNATKEKEVVAKFIELLPSAYKRRFEKQAEQAEKTVEDVVSAFLKEKLLPVYARADKSAMGVDKEGRPHEYKNSLTQIGGLLAAYGKEEALGKHHVNIRKFFANLEAAKNGKDVEAYNAVVAAIMNAAALTYGDVLDVVGLKGDMLKDYVEGGFGTGIVEGTDQYEAAKRLVVTGRGVPMAAIRQSAGRRVMDELGIKVGGKGRVALEGELIAVFGQIVIETMKDPRTEVAGSGLSGKIGVKKGVFDKETGMLKEEMTEAEKQEVDETKTAAVLLLNITQENKQLLREVAGTLEFMGEQSDGAIALKPKKEKKGQMKVLHSAVVAGDTTVEYANKKNAEEWTFEGTFPDFYADVMKEAKGNPDEALKIATEVILGERDAVIANEQVSDVEGALAKYDADALAIQRMIMAYEVVNEKVPFYLRWAYTISGRYMIANRMMNPQNSKISRHFVSTKDMRSTMDRESADFKKDLDIARLAMAQAFDGSDLGVDVELGIDKLLDEDGLKEFDKLVTFDEKGTPTILNEKIAKAVELYKAGDKLGAMKALDFVEVSHKTHAFQAADLLARLSGTDSVIEHTMTIEADGITNGMIIMLLQIGGERALELLRAGGVYFGEEGEMTHAMYKKAGGLDIYEMPKKELEAKFDQIVKASEKLDDLKEMLFGENGIYHGNKEGLTDNEKTTITKQVQAMVGMVKTNVGTGWRKALKPMVMVFIYGAGMKGIIANGAGRNVYASGMIVDGLVKLLKSKNANDQQLAKEFLKTMNAEHMMQYKVYDKDKSMLVNDASKDIKNLYVTPEMERYLVGKFADAFTGVFEEVFTNAFEPVIKLRKALKTLSVVQYAVFRTELAKKVADKTQVTKEELAGVLREMMREGTYYGATNAQGTWQDYVKMEKGVASPNMDAADKIAARVFENEIGTAVGQYPMTLNAVMKWFKSNTGSVGVINAHDVDGQTMAEGNATGALNIYDALVLAASMEAKSDIQGMNTALASISGQHSMVEKAVKLVEKHLDTLQAEGLEAEVAKELVDALAWAYNTKDVEKLADRHTAEFTDAMEAIAKGRGELAGRKAVVNHYYVSDMLASQEAVDLGDVAVPNMGEENIRKVVQFVKDVLEKAQEKDNTKADSNTRLDRIQNMAQKAVNPNDINMMICKE